MSIPPLVCSTPPPLDQCDDDKDPEDFDEHYNLSQDEDDDSNEYNYGNITTYNNIPDSSHTEKETILKTDHILTLNNSPDTDNYTASQISNNNNGKNDEEIIEDLDLKFDKVSISSGKINTTGSVEEIPSESLENDVIRESNSEEPEDIFVETDAGDGTIPPSSESSSLEENISNYNQHHTPHMEDVETKEPSELNNDQISQEDTNSIEEKVTHLNNAEIDVLQFPGKPESDIALTNSNTIQSKNSQSSEQITIEDNDEDFGDFDNFKFVSSNDKTETISNFDPWGQGETSSSNFEADFGEPTAQIPETNLQPPGVSKTPQQEDPLEENDDFGDFDDFKSSAVSEGANDGDESPEYAQDQPMFNLQSAENEEVIVTVINSIFEESLDNTESRFKGKLELSLSETWGYLMEVEERQPYMVNWNNALGQKTLLRALCIDSRNILYGPKWGYNMPRYASNLSAAPLQPQKPVSSASNVLCEGANQEKPSSKTAETWVDPFTPDGKESCNAASTSSEQVPPAPNSPGKEIYSATLDIQPLRQINLPDTHIFTPTDSEIPRSKTIHYDNSAVVEDEYSDFQDFKVTKPTMADANSSIVDNNTVLPTKAPDPNIAYKTSMLQPVKVEPIMPTLNWPDPGQVKEQFDDYSDFISSTNWNNVTQDTTPSEEALGEAVKLGCPSAEFISAVVERVGSRLNDSASGDVKTPGSSFDDEFDTFQSAAPTAAATTPLATVFPGLSTVVTSSLPSQGVVGNTADFDMSFTVFDNVSKIKTDNISVNSMPDTYIDAQPSYQSYIPNNVNHKQDSPHSFVGSQKTDILQPPAPSATHKQATGQILQPLSLESYSQINWPNPGSLDFQDLSRFNPVETLPSFRADFGSGGNSKNASPAHSQKGKATDDDWGDFVSSKPKQASAQPSKRANRLANFADDDEWTDFVSSGTVQPQNGLNTISLNVHTNLSMQKPGSQSKYKIGTNQVPLDIPTLNYVTPKANSKTYSDRHFQNL